MHNMIYGKTCIIAQQIKKQKKTSRCKVLNWIYKVLYGYTYESVLPPETSFIVIGDKLIFRDQQTYDMVKSSVLENK